MIGEQIKKLRKHFDLTQREFGERIGVKPNTIGTYEIGRNEPIDAVVSLICREFGVNEKWLRTGEGEMLQQTESNAIMQLCADMNASAEEAVLLREVLQSYFKIDAKIREPFVQSLFQFINKGKNVKPVDEVAVKSTTNTAQDELIELKRENAELRQQNQQLQKQQEQIDARLAALEEEDAQDAKADTQSLHWLSSIFDSSSNIT